MCRFYVLVSLLVGTLLCNSANASNWLIKESDDRQLFAVLPVRVDNTTIGGFEAKNIALYKNGKRLNGYGFTIKKDGNKFDFNQESVPRFYLKSSSSKFNHGSQAVKWDCDNTFFKAVVKGQEQRINKGYPGLSHYYPKGTGFEAKYIKTTEVLGQKKIQEKMRAVEVWGLAKGKANAEKMIAYYESRMLNSTYHYFNATHKNFSQKKRLLADTVEVDFSTNSVETQSDKGNILKGVKYRRADFFMNLSVNGISTNWKDSVKEGRKRVRSGNHSSLKWYWSNPGWHSENIAGRYVQCYVRSEGNNSDIWVQYKGNGSDDDMDIVNVRIPKCN